MYDITVEVSGKEHSGKTSLIVLIAELLKEHGIENVVLQRADHQIDDKLSDLDAARARVMNSSILVRELNTKF